jgi:hypothetical protein
MFGMQVLCGLTSLQQVEVLACGCDTHAKALAVIPAAKSPLQSLRSLQSSGHDMLRALPPELHSLIR